MDNTLINILNCSSFFIVLQRTNLMILLINRYYNTASYLYNQILSFFWLKLFKETMSCFSSCRFHFDHYHSKNYYIYFNIRSETSFSHLSFWFLKTFANFTLNHPPSYLIYFIASQSLSLISIIKILSTTIFIFKLLFRNN
jgi:hypothetical protein